MSRAGFMKPEAAASWAALTAALTRCTTTPCQIDPEPFTSDDPDVRAEAAEACGHCPARQQCQEFAETNKEPFHVWGGHDHTPTTRARRTAA